MLGPLKLSSLRPEIFAIVVLVVASLGCGRTELFGMRKKCAPNDTLCQAQLPDAGVDRPNIDGKPNPDGNPNVDGKPNPDGNPNIDGKPAVDVGPDMRPDGPVTCVQMPEICNNGKDDNCNGLADCKDPSCLGDKACTKPGQEVCNNAIDDDDDKLVDCADPDCKGSIACVPTMGPEDCANGKDDNNDRLVDCADPQCTMFPACLEVACSADVDFGAIAPHGASVSRGLSTLGATRGYSTCATPGGVGRVGRFVLTETTDVRVDFSQMGGAAHAVAVFRAGANQACDRNPVGACLAAGAAPSATRTFAALGAGTYWLVVESYPMTTGSTNVTLSTGIATTPEQCANGVDDDKNGLIDCQDAACRGAANCSLVECSPDANLGALVIDAPPKNVRVDLAQGKDQYMPFCAGTTPGRAIALALTLPEAGGLEVAFTQTGEAVFALFREPAPGFACDDGDARAGCALEDQRAGAVAFQDLAAGRYILIFKANGDRTGVLNLRVSAFGNRGTEICGNGIDDDADKLIDCDDPECFGVGTCGAPACMPDVDLGAVGVGTTVSTSVDTRGAPDFYDAGCGKGNGPERVVRFEVTEALQLGVDCSGSGSHVLSLARQLGPLDKCDAEVNRRCADPETLPFGCGYSIPDVQPGTYNFIVEAFAKGTEGVLSLKLTGIHQTIGEICDNGVDDDGDGLADCMDRKCVTDASCLKFSCRPDESLGILPLDGSFLPTVVQTSDAGDDQTQTPCVSAGGGQDAVVDFQVPARADVTLEWAQAGNHAFALYDTQAAVLSCEAGTRFDCTPSAGKTTGTQVYSALPAGRYHLVVDADHPGSEGGVVIRLSGKPAP